MTTVSVDELIARLDAFDEAAKSWGWQEDQGYDGDRIQEASDEYISTRRALEEAIRSLSESKREMEKALEPFSDVAGEMFARGWDASNVALALDNPNDAHRVTAGDFFAARAVIAKEAGHAE